MRSAFLVGAACCVAGLPAGPLVAAGPAITFSDVTEAAGLREPLAGMLGHGAAWGDIDRDGDPDLFVGGFADRPDDKYGTRGKPPRNVLLENRGDGTFVLVEETPAAAWARTSGAVFADLDNDGWPELVVGNNAKEKARADRGDIQRTATTQRSQLFRNVAGRFVDISNESGACPARLRSARNVLPLDYDGDGRLDLFVVEDRFCRDPRSALYRNLGELRFEDVTAASGLPDDLFGLGTAFTTLGGGRGAALFVAHSNRFFLLRDGAFEEVPSLSRFFAWEPLHGEDWPCGAAFGDLNRDGEPELVLSIHGEPARNRLYLNTSAAGGSGPPTFRDITASAGFPDRWPTRVPHVEMHDFDNDGWLDLYFSAGWLDAEGRVTPLVYRHLGCEPGGVPRFEAPAAPKEGKPVYFPAGPAADYDRDGRIDLMLVNWFDGNECRLLRNTTAGGGWLGVQVRSGGRLNRDGIGVTVEIPGVGTRVLTTGYGYASGQVPVAHFGVGDREEVERVVVRGPGGLVVERRMVRANQLVTIEVP